MIRFEVYETDTGKLARTFLCRDGRFVDDLYMDMYDWLMRVFDLAHEEADEAASWCELSVVGQWYEGDGFEIYVEEE